MQYNKENDWYTTFAVGKNFELYCLKDINNKKYPLAYTNENKDEYSYYDIILFNGDFNENNKPKTIECKFDERARETGNICIEVGCNGRLSGLLITKADFWLISDGQKMFLIKKSSIVDCILQNDNNIKLKKKYPVTQKSNEVKEMDFYLIPKEMFEKYCLEVSTISDMKYEKMI